MFCENNSADCTGKNRTSRQNLWNVYYYNTAAVQADTRVIIYTNIE